MMNAHVTVMSVCVVMNGTAPTLKTNFYELAETTFFHLIFHANFLYFFQSFLSS